LALCYIKNRRRRHPWPSGASEIFDTCLDFTNHFIITTTKRGCGKNDVNLLC
jgi:hypothetical protein